MSINDELFSHRVKLSPVAIQVELEDATDANTDTETHTACLVCRGQKMLGKTRDRDNGRLSIKY